MSSAHDRASKVKNAFYQVLDRMLSATTEAEAEAEMSNALSQTYRLGELCKRELGRSKFHKLLGSSTELRSARAALWARTFDTHDVVETADLRSGYAGGYAAGYGSALIWRPRSQLPQVTDKFGRHLDYEALLADRGVVDTLPPAFSALLTLL